jgi:hypothetical protein
VRENGLLDQPGWKRFRHIIKNEKTFTRMVNQAKLKSFNTTSKYKYGYKIPRTCKQAKCLDQRNGNTLWGDATVLELNQIDEYVTSLIKATTLRSAHRVDTRKLGFTWYMTSKMTVDIRPDWLQMEILPISHLIWYIQV